MDHFESLLKKVAGMASAQREFASPFLAGRDAAINGPNPSNCHFCWFADPISTKEWERGKGSVSQPGDDHGS